MHDLRISKSTSFLIKYRICRNNNTGSLIFRTTKLTGPLFRPPPPNFHVLPPPLEKSRFRGGGRGTISVGATNSTKPGITLCTLFSIGYAHKSRSHAMGESHSRHPGLTRTGYRATQPPSVGPQTARPKESRPVQYHGAEHSRTRALPTDRTPGPFIFRYWKDHVLLQK